MSTNYSLDISLVSVLTPKNTLDIELFIRDLTLYTQWLYNNKNKMYAVGVQRGMGPSVFREGSGVEDIAVANARRSEAQETPSRTNVVVHVVTATAIGDQARAYIGHCVLVATAERLLPGDILRGTGVPISGGLLGCRGRRPKSDRHADHAGCGEVVDQRGGVRAVRTRRPPAFVDRLLVGHGGLSHSGGADLSAHNHGRCRRRL